MLRGTLTQVWPWGVLTLLLATMALFAHGRLGGRQDQPIAVSTDLGFAERPPLDEQAPTDLETATFSLG